MERYSYDVFGEPNRVSNVGNPYLFTGRRYDSEAKLYYYRARYYKPSIGRFLQADPIGYEAGLNLYTYCGNNPINLVDPFGLNPTLFEKPIIRRSTTSRSTLDLSDPSNYSLRDVFNLASNMEQQIYGSDAALFNNNFRHAYAAALIARKYPTLGESIVEAYNIYNNEPLNTMDAITDRLAEQNGLEIAKEAEELGQSIAETLLEYFPLPVKIPISYSEKDSLINP